MVRKDAFSIVPITKIVGFVVFVLVGAVMSYKITTENTDPRSLASELRKDSSIFSDVKKNSYAFGAIERLYRLGITSGCGQNPLQYCPDRGVTRSEAAVLIVKAYTKTNTPPSVGSASVFADVAVDRASRSYIEKLYADKLTSGCALNPLRFCPDKALTRAEMAVFFVRALHGVDFVPTEVSGIFTDVNSSTLFAPYIEQLKKDGFATIMYSPGHDSNLNCSTPGLSFCPTKAATRADIAILLERLYDRSMQTTFTDVPINHWAFSSIQRIAREKITSGCTSTTFCPDAPTTRGQVAVMLVRAKNGVFYEPPASVTDTELFSDVPKSHYYYKYIQQIAADGITSGCGGGKFCPDTPLTRGQAAVFLMRMQEGKTYSPPSFQRIFTDVSEDTPFATFINAFYNEAITVGCSLEPFMFCPSKLATRAQFAIFINRLFDLY